MNILYVYAHPNPDSFNAQLKEIGLQKLKEKKYQIKTSDLYEQKFNALASFHDFDLRSSERDAQYFLSQKLAFEKGKLSSDIQEEIKKIEWADHLIFQFPLWWFSVPAILKGWFDRVLVKGFAYDTGKIFSDGLLKGKTASLVLTTQSPEEAYQKEGIHRETIDAFLLPIQHTLRFSGIKTINPFVAYSIFNLEEEKQKLIFEKYEFYLEENLSTK